MSDTSNIFKDLQGFKIPPIDKWHPDNVVDFDIRIDVAGNWYHEGDLMKRRRLVKLFASVLRREEDGHYYLVTPPTKYRIQVDDVPFIVVEMHVENQTKPDQTIYFRTNMDDEVCLNKAHPLSLRDYQHQGIQLQDEALFVPYVYIRQGLSARLSRAVHFQLAELIQQDELNSGLVLFSAGERFVVSENSQQKR